MLRSLDGSVMVENRRPWVVFFSQTGSEIVKISESLGRWPDLIITNKRPDHLRKINKKIEKRGYLTLPNKPIQEDYFGILQNYPDAFITLHGWLRIVPESIADGFKMYNGHPGLITLYPELKGKDPQVKAFELGHKTVGCVIHEVTAGVDEGKILRSQAFVSKEELDIDKIFLILSNISTEMWVKFIKYYL